MSAPYHPRAVNATTRAALNRSKTGHGRVLVELSAHDRADYEASKKGLSVLTVPGPWIAATERITGTAIRIRAAACGASCVCDMEVDATNVATASTKNTP